MENVNIQLLRTINSANDLESKEEKNIDVNFLENKLKEKGLFDKFVEISVLIEKREAILKTNQSVKYFIDLDLVELEKYSELNDDAGYYVHTKSGKLLLDKIHSQINNELEKNINKQGK